MKRILIACEFSGIVREAFKRRGWDAWSCDLLPTEIPGQHIQGDIFEALRTAGRFNLAILHPPCTYLSSSGLHWNKRRPGRALLTEEAISFATALWESACSLADSVAMENPVGCLSTRFLRPSQIIQPHEYGEDASKATCLWLHNLPPLAPTKHIAPRIVGGLKRWANQTDSGQNRLAPSEHRAADRSRTFPGIAEAMADQWGGL